MEKSLELVVGTRDRVIISDSSWFDNKDSLSLSLFLSRSRELEDAREIGERIHFRPGFPRWQGIPRFIRP